MFYLCIVLVLKDDCDDCDDDMCWKDCIGFLMNNIEL